MSVSSVKIYVNMALEYLDRQYRIDDIEPNLRQAEQRLPNLSPADAAPLIAQIADIRSKLNDMVSPADERQVKAAQGKVRQARDFIDINHGYLTESGKDHVEELFRIAVQFLDKIADARKADSLKAPVLQEISRIRLQYGTTGTAAPAPPTPKPAASVPPSQNFPNAKRKVFWANDYFSTPGRVEQTEPELAQAEELLKGDASGEADALRAEISALREKLADIVMPSEEAYVRAAQRDVKNIREFVEQQRGFLDRGDTEQDLDRQLQKIIDEGLSKVTHPRKGDQLKAPILAEIAQIRSQFGFATPTWNSQQPSQPVQAQPQYQAQSVARSAAPVDVNALSIDDQDRLSRANRVIRQARTYMESRRTEGVENLLFDATSMMAPVSAAHKDHLVVEIEQLRQDLEATRLEERTRVITGDLDRKLRGIEMDIETPDRLQYSIISFKQRFERDEVRRTLTPKMYSDYETRFADTLAAGAAHVKAETLKRAHPALQRLQEKLSTNPFTDLPQYEANRVDGELRSMRWQVEKEIIKLPEDDVDRLRLQEELKDTDAKVAAYSNEWGKAGMHDSVKQGWQMIRNEFQGWEQESLGPDAQPLDEPNMPLTRLAIRRVHYYLHKDTSVRQTRNENPGDSVISATDREAEQLLEAAGAKMTAAFDQIMEAAEKMETPIEDRWLRGKPGHLITSAEGTFEDTKFCEPVVDRIRALDQRWKDELADVHEYRKNLGEKLSLEATQKWPSIVATIPTVSGFDPSSARPGDAVHLSGVYNRAGWDFDGHQFDFSMRFNGVPLGGIYEPYINKAIDHAAYELKLDIDDHQEWDLVGIVLGSGSIRERTERTIRRGMDYEKVEEWLPIDCLRLRIIALRAGPVVVGPQN